MTDQEINQVILEGTNKYGNRNAYLASAEYREVYKQFTATPKVSKKIEIVEAAHLGTGFFIRVGKNSYEAQIGDGIGAGSGPLNFSTLELAKVYCSQRKYSL